jgi:hypothetical protein
VTLNPLPDLTAHPLLTPKAKQMAMESPTRFAEEEALAADLLTITQELYDGAEDTDGLDRAIVLQVNFSLARDMSPLYASAESGQREGESKSYREQRELLVNPVAARIVAAVLGDTYPSDPSAAYSEGVASLRGRRPVPQGDGDSRAVQFDQ